MLTTSVLFLCPSLQVRWCTRRPPWLTPCWTGCSITIRTGFTPPPTSSSLLSASTPTRPATSWACWASMCSVQPGTLTINKNVVVVVVQWSFRFISFILFPVTLWVSWPQSIVHSASCRELWARTTSPRSLMEWLESRTGWVSFGRREWCVHTHTHTHTHTHWHTYKHAQSLVTVTGRIHVHLQLWIWCFVYSCPFRVYSCLRWLMFKAFI